MEKNLNLKQIQEFFSKPLEENNKISDDKLMRLIPKMPKDYVGKNTGIGEYTISTPDGKDIVLTQSKDKKNWSYEPSNVALKILNESYDYDEVAQSEFGMDYDQLGPGEKEWVRDEMSMNEIDMNDPILMKMRAAKMKADKFAGSDPKAGSTIKGRGFDWDKNTIKIDKLKKKRAQLMRDMEQEAEPEGGPIDDEYGSKLNRIDAAIAKLSGRKEMTYDQAIDEVKVDYDFSERELIRVLRQLKRGASTEIDMIKAFTKALGRDITKDELFSESIAENKILKQAKLSSAEYQKAKKLKDFNKDDYKWNPGESLYIKLNEDDREDDELTPEELANKYAGSPFFGENIAQTLAETIKLGEGVIEEELCPKGKAYIKRRKAAGEKSSAYLSGRAVKVCKGQMSGRKKKK